MKDRHDRATGDLLQSAGARRQAALRARREAEGWRRSTVWLRPADVEAGRLAAASGGTVSDCPAEADRLSWLVGFTGG